MGAALLLPPTPDIPSLNWEGTVEGEGVMVEMDLGQLC